MSVRSDLHDVLVEAKAAVDAIYAECMSVTGEASPASPGFKTIPMSVIRERQLAEYVSDMLTPLVEKTR